MSASALFSANLQILYMKASYFAQRMRENALLHLWSLGV
jgi:hypothetical protein